MPRAKPTLDPPSVKAAQIIKDVATSGRADPSLSTAQEDQGRLAFEAGKGAFLLNWPYVWAAAHADAESNPTTAKVAANMGYAQYPSREPRRAEPRVDRRRQPRHPEDRARTPSWPPRPRCA